MDTQKKRKHFWHSCIIRRLPFLIFPLLTCGAWLRLHFQEAVPEREGWEIPVVLGCLAAMLAFVILRPRRMPVWIGCVLLSLLPFADVCLMELYSHNPFTMDGGILLLNMLFYLIAELVLLCLVRRTAPAGMLPTAAAMLMGLANYFTVLYRDVPISPWDFASLRTAANVADSYSFEISWKVLAILAGNLLALSAALWTNGVLWKKTPFRRPGHWIPRACCLLAACGLLAGYLSYIRSNDAKTRFGLNDTLFVPNTIYGINGFTVAFLRNFKYLGVDKPDGYTAPSLKTRMEEYETASADSAENPPEVLPNIIVIMNEAFSDLSVLSDCSLITSSDPTPYIHMLQEGERVLYGNTYVSIIGGNTANSEFEFLTGSSLAFLPIGCVPYQQYVNGATPSLVSQLASLGYTTLAMHPYYASGWDRDTVYVDFGFDKMMFIRDFTKRAYLRSCVSDLSNYKQIFDEFEKKEKGKPIFIFNVTMQNHSGYSKTYDNFKPSISALNVTSSQLNTYLSLMKRTDSAYSSLLSYFQNCGEPTVILMYGDHQPADSVVKPLYTAAGLRMEDLTLAQRSERYITPFLLWANFPIETGNAGDISANYLSTLLMQTIGLPLTPQQEMLAELRERFPVVTANFYRDADGTLYETGEDLRNDAAWNLAASVQYNLLHDRRGRLEELFALPDVS